MNPHDDDYWFWLGSDRITNPATGESLSTQGMPRRPMRAPRAPGTSWHRPPIVRRDERAAES